MGFEMKMRYLLLIADMSLIIANIVPKRADIGHICVHMSAISADIDDKWPTYCLAKWSSICCFERLNSC